MSKRETEWMAWNGGLVWVIQYQKVQSRCPNNKKSLCVSPIDHALFVLANRNVYLVTPWKIYIYYIDTEYKWGILSGILWLCCKTNCHICLNSCFTIPILQSSSTCLYSETILFPKPLYYTMQKLTSLFFNFILWNIATVALQLAIHSIKLRYCSCNITEEQCSHSFLR